MNNPAPDKDQRTIIRLYAALGAGLVFSLVPLLSAAVISAALIIGVLVIAYVLRTDSAEGSLTENHTTFIIRTIWIGSFFALVTITAASLYLFRMVDNTPLQPCLGQLFEMAMRLPTMVDVHAMETLMKNFTGSECWTSYWRTNMMAFIVSAIIAAGPVLLYFLVRYARGVTRAAGGYRVAYPKAWL